MNQDYMDKPQVYHLFTPRARRPMQTSSGADAVPAGAQLHTLGDGKSWRRIHTREMVAVLWHGHTAQQRLIDNHIQRVLYVVVHYCLLLPTPLLPTPTSRPQHPCPATSRTQPREAARAPHTSLRPELHTPPVTSRPRRPPVGHSARERSVHVAVVGCARPMARPACYLGGEGGTTRI